MRVEVDVVIRFPDKDGGHVTHRTAEGIRAVVKNHLAGDIDAGEQGWQIRGLWVHEAPPKAEPESVGRDELASFEQWLKDRVVWLKKEWQSGGSYEHLSARERECVHILEMLRRRRGS